MRTRHARAIRRGILAGRGGHSVGGPIAWHAVLITALERDAYESTRWRMTITSRPPRPKRPVPVRRTWKAF